VEHNNKSHVTAKLYEIPNISGVTTHNKLEGDVSLNSSLPTEFEMAVT
jgi:hypothetical protein